ncbi:T9SS type A sorting domain-containing protein [bacterium]|nr:T9SS type A sorting domain-containing protein [bacterium]
MKKLATTLCCGLFLCAAATQGFAQDGRKEVNVPRVDPAAVVIDGQMTEAEWQTAAQANLITATGYEFWANKYYRESLTEPDYDEWYARMLWAEDTLYVFVHIDEIVNDSTNLYWNGKFTGDQLFVSLSSRLGVDLEGNYDGNPYAAPEGPYHFFILGDQVTLNGGDPTGIPDAYQCSEADTLPVVFEASAIARWATFIDVANGVWNVEMAIYHPNVTAQSSIGFNLGGSTGSTQSQEQFGDAYAYYTWQPNVPDDPYATPNIPEAQDPGFYNLVNSSYWAVLNFTPGGNEVYVRKEVDVPVADPAAVVIDGQMTEAEWQTAAQANLITATGYEFWANKYYRESLTEPDYDEWYARMLWAEDTLYVFVHIDEIVNDSTNLYWNGKFTGDQLFVSLSSRLGVDLEGNYDGNPYAAPEGPYHFFILGDQVTLNGGDPTGIPDAYQCSEADTLPVVFEASAIARWATFIDVANGVWNVEMAIYHPNVTAQSSIGFNLGGSTGSTQSQEQFGDAYAYYTWQPNVPDDPYATPNIPEAQDPGFYNLVNSDYWALLNFLSGEIVGVEQRDADAAVPARFLLSQNYPNPFNPSTTIRFELTKNSPVTLKVYNAVGQLVATLLEARPFAPGRYTVNWNAGDLTSGVYFYKLEAAGVVQSKKMTLVK